MRVTFSPCKMVKFFGRRRGWEIVLECRHRQRQQIRHTAYWRMYARPYLHFTFQQKQCNDHIPNKHRKFSSFLLKISSDALHIMCAMRCVKSEAAKQKVMKLIIEILGKCLGKIESSICAIIITRKYRIRKT